MSVKRMRDPAGLLPDVSVVDDLTSANTRPGAEEWEEIRAQLEAATPLAKIGRLELHASLIPIAARLRERYMAAGEKADRALLHDITLAEKDALYLAAYAKAKQATAAQAQRKDASLSATRERADAVAARATLAKRLAANVPERIRAQGAEAVAREVKKHAAELDSDEGAALARVTTKTLKALISRK